jgi:hypothetical protein
MKVDPKHQRSPMVKILGSKAGRLSNPIPFEERIAKCRKCKNHFHLPKMKDDLCLECAGIENSEVVKNVDKPESSEMS